MAVKQIRRYVITHERIEKIERNGFFEQTSQHV